MRKIYICIYVYEMRFLIYRHSLPLRCTFTLLLSDKSHCHPLQNDLQVIITLLNFDKYACFTHTLLFIHAIYVYTMTLTQFEFGGSKAGRFDRSTSRIIKTVSVSEVRSCCQVMNLYYELRESIIETAYCTFAIYDGRRKKKRRNDWVSSSCTKNARGVR